MGRNRGKKKKHRRTTRPPRPRLQSQEGGQVVEQDVEDTICYLNKCREAAEDIYRDNPGAMEMLPLDGHDFPSEAFGMFVLHLAAGCKEGGTSPVHCYSHIGLVLDSAFPNATVEQRQALMRRVNSHITTIYAAKEVVIIAG